MAYSKLYSETVTTFLSFKNLAENQCLNQGHHCKTENNGVVYVASLNNSILPQTIEPPINLINNTGAVNFEYSAIFKYTLFSSYDDECIHIYIYIHI